MRSCQLWKRPFDLALALIGIGAGDRLYRQKCTFTLVSTRCSHSLFGKPGQVVRICGDSVGSVPQECSNQGTPPFALLPPVERTRVPAQPSGAHVQRRASPRLDSALIISVIGFLIRLYFAGCFASFELANRQSSSCSSSRPRACIGWTEKKSLRWLFWRSTRQRVHTAELSWYLPIT